MWMRKTYTRNTIISPALNQAQSLRYRGITHSCPKSVLKKTGGREAKLRRKKKTKMEIEFWGASY
jgi:hypothetical protein